MVVDGRRGFVGSMSLGNSRTYKADEESKGSRKITVLFAFLVIAMIIAALFLSMTELPPTVEESPASTSYSPRGIISIVGDIGFTPANGVTSGTGTVGDPYIIDGYEINSSIGHAISITGTRAYFEVRNCYLHSGTTNWHGILMTNVENGTIKNNIVQNNSYGIFLDQSHWNHLFMNNVSLNSLDGIFLDACHNDTIDNNTCWSNLWNGVFLSLSTNNTLNNNTCSYNKCIGIYLEASSNNTINWNNCLRNTDDGIGMFWLCNGNVVYQNVATNNTDYGCSISTSCAGNLIYDNTFMFNRGSGVWPAFNPAKVQGFDINGPTNFWSLAGRGNYWHDWTGPDVAPPGGDGIVDNAYLLDPGLAIDPFPLTTWTVIPEPAILILAGIMIGAFLMVGRARKKP